jgi:hypothetical protein
MVLLLFLLFAPFALFSVGGATGWTAYPDEQVPTAPFTLRVAGEDAQRAGEESIGTGEVTNLDVGDLVTITPDKGESTLLLHVREYFCDPDDIKAKRILAAGQSWKVPKLPPGLYTLEVSDSRDRGYFGFAIGNGGDMESC